MLGDTIMLSIGNSAPSVLDYTGDMTGNATHTYANANSPTLSNNNLTVSTGAQTTNRVAYGSENMIIDGTSKYYFEVYADTWSGATMRQIQAGFWLGGTPISGNIPFYSIGKRSSFWSGTSASANGWEYYRFLTSTSSATIENYNGLTSPYDIPVSGDIYGFYFDSSSNTAKFTQNGTLYRTATMNYATNARWIPFLAVRYSITSTLRGERSSWTYDPEDLID